MTCSLKSPCPVEIQAIQLNHIQVSKLTVFGEVQDELAADLELSIPKHLKSKRLGYYENLGSTYRILQIFWLKKKQIPNSAEQCEKNL